MAAGGLRSSRRHSRRHSQRTEGPFLGLDGTQSERGFAAGFAAFAFATAFGCSLSPPFATVTSFALRFRFRFRLWACALVLNVVLFFTILRLLRSILRLLRLILVHATVLHRPADTRFRTSGWHVCGGFELVFRLGFGLALTHGFGGGGLGGLTFLDGEHGFGGGGLGCSSFLDGELVVFLLVLSLRSRSPKTKTRSTCRLPRWTPLQQELLRAVRGSGRR